MTGARWLMTVGATRAAIAGLVALLALPLAGAAQAEVLFQNTGDLRLAEQAGKVAGWERVYTQQQGSITVVPSPTFQGGGAIRSWQTYLASGDGRYHSEAVKFDIQRDGQDLYYGQAMYLPPDWQFHGDNVTFQQWGLENPGGGAPWILMFVINDQLRVAGVRRAAFGTHTIASIAELRGTWIRIVTRLRMAAPGNFEVWVNGVKRLSLTPANLTGDGDPPTIRWATGIYCTEWVNQAPLGPRSLEILHDHLRIATTYEEAEPASWREDGSFPGDAGLPPADALTDGAVAEAGDAAPSGSGGGVGGGNGAGGVFGGGGGGAPGGSGGAGAGGVQGGGATGAAGIRGTRDAAPQAPAPGGPDGGDCGCRLGVVRKPPVPAVTAVVLALLLIRRRRRR